MLCYDFRLVYIDWCVMINSSPRKEKKKEGMGFIILRGEVIDLSKNPLIQLGNAIGRC